jgi:hypothetical protein
MNKREARRLGIDRGYNIGMYCEERDYDAFLAACGEAEENDRQFSPFEFTAYAINAAGDRADGLWEAFDEGIFLGFERAWRGRP